jgi:hypothetical protein
MGWNAGLPLSSSKVIITSSLYLDNFDAMNDAVSIEHYGMTSSLSGRHRPGLAGATFVGTSSAISALTAAANLGPGDGALAFSTTSGCTVRFTESGAISAWRNVGVTLPVSRVMVRAAAVTVTSGTSGIPFSGATENVDTLSEFNSTTGVFSAKSAGYYFVSASVMATASSGSTWGIGFCGNNGWEPSLNQVTPSFSANNTCLASHLVALTASQSLACYAYSPTSTLGISGAAAASYMSIYRVC